MSTIIVIRGTGDRKGTDILDPLLYSLEAKLARGKAEMDEHAVAQQTVDLTVVYRPGLRLGQLVSVHDAVQGESWEGKIVGIAHNMVDTELLTHLAIKRPQRNF